MIGPLYLAWRYLVFHWVKATILVLSIALIAFLPAGLNVLVGQSAVQLRARAEATPLLLGAKGSPLELALSSLYFESRAPEPVGFDEVERVAATGLADAIPLHVGFRVGAHPVVGTSPTSPGAGSRRSGVVRWPAWASACSGPRPPAASEWVRATLSSRRA